MTTDTSENWRTALTCEGGACVEVGEGRRGTLVRDKADRGGPVLEFTPDAWRAFTGALKAS